MLRLRGHLQPDPAGDGHAPAGSARSRNIVATGADAVVTANPGCIIQIVQGLRAKGVAVEVLHIVELLDQAYGGAVRARSGGAGLTWRMARVWAIDQRRICRPAKTALVHGQLDGRGALPPRRRGLRHRRRVPAPGRQPLRGLGRGRHRHLPAPRLGVRPALGRVHDHARRESVPRYTVTVEDGAIYLEEPMREPGSRDAPD